MILAVDLASPVPPYEQIRAQIATMAASGVLSEGARLPTIRQLAVDLDLAPGTVSRAYRELETAGVIITRGRHGTYVNEQPSWTPGERSQRLRAAAETYARSVDQLGATNSEAIGAVRRVLAT